MNEWTMGTDNLLNCLYPKNNISQLKKPVTYSGTTRLGKECPFPPHTTRSFGSETNEEEVETSFLESTKASQSNEVEVEKTVIPTIRVTISQA